MLLRCPECGGSFESGQLRARTGTAVCEAHGEVRPRSGRPRLGGAVTSPPGGDWSASWSQPWSSSYRLEVTIHPSLKAVLAPSVWEYQWGAAGDLWGDLAGLILGVPMFAFTYVPRLFSPRILIDKRLVRFGPRFRRLRGINEFVVRKEGPQASCLAVDENLDEPLDILECARPVSALLGLRDTLNEALFVVAQHPAPELESRTPYRG